MIWANKKKLNRKYSSPRTTNHNNNPFNFKSYMKISIFVIRNQINHNQIRIQSQNYHMVVKEEKILKKEAIRILKKNRSAGKLKKLKFIEIIYFINKL
jgi:hypothetical protein